MSGKKMGIARRTLAMLLSMMVLLGTVPISAMAEVLPGHPNVYTMTVKDSADQPIDGASVTYSISSALASMNVVDQTAGTSADGVAELDAMVDFSGYSDIELVYSVTKAGYRDKSDTIEVVEVTENIDVTLLTNNQVMVSVVKTGSGDVQLNGQVGTSLIAHKNTDVNVNMWGTELGFISSLKVNGATQSIPEENKYSYNTTRSFTEDTTIEVAFGHFIKTSTNNSYGTIKLNDTPASNGSYEFSDGSSVPVLIQATEGYAIQEIKIDGSIVGSPYATSFDSSITVSKEHTINVKFVKIYTVAVTYNSEGGGVTKSIPTTTPMASGGTVVIEEGKALSVIATPITGYCVSYVNIDNGETILENLGNTYTASKPYKYEISAINESHTVAITFAPMTFNVTAVTPSPGQPPLHGQITVLNPVVEYNGTSTVNILPDIGFSIKEVKVNDVKVSNPPAVEGGYFQLVLNDITQDKEISVIYEATSLANESDYQFNSSDAIRSNAEGSLFVFHKESTVTFSSPQGYHIFAVNTNGALVPSPMHPYPLPWVTSFQINNSQTIKALWVENNGWHLVDTISAANPLKIVIDKTVPEITFQTDAPITNGFYNGDVNMSVTATDPGDYSGLSSVTYTVTCDDVPTMSGTLYARQNGTFIPTITSDIPISAASHNSDNVLISVIATDLAGNTYTRNQTLKINITQPTVSITMDGTKDTLAQNTYYKSVRTATITIEDRDSCFDSDKVLEGISITATDANGNLVTIKKSSMISNWTDVGNTHTATLTFSTDAKYSWSIAYTNTAGLPNTPVNTIGSDVFAFTVDKNAPSGTIELEADDWSKLLSSLTFGIWKNYAVIALATGSDTTSPLYPIQYYKTSSETALTTADLEKLYSEGNFSTTAYTVNADEKFVIYARIVDYAGNVAYISTDGVVVDKSAGEITFAVDAPNPNDIHNKDVNVMITVNEDKDGTVISSGICSVDYKVIKDDDFAHPTQSENLYTFNTSNPSYSQLLKNFQKSIIVDKDNNDSSNVKLIVTVKDNAGNEYQKTEQMSISATPPQVKLTFDNNASEMTIGSRGYFSGARTATITIEDRSDVFDAAAATAGIDISAVDAKNQPITLDTASMISAWTSVGDTHTATVTFSTSGNYTWSMTYTNKADNTSTSTDVTDCETPYMFTIDPGVPTGKVLVEASFWDQLLTIITFGIYSNTSLAVNAEAEDAISPVTIEYFKTSNPAAMTVEDLESETFQIFTPFSIESDEQFVIYLRITDAAGNISYISSDGCVVDKTGSQITLTPDAPNANGLYRADVNVAVEVSDSEPYSGIRLVDYWIVKDGDNEHPTQQGNLFTATAVNPTQAELVETWTGSAVVTTSLNNSCNVIFYVRTTDNAGNVVTESIPLDIDCSAPAIQVSYDNNADNAGNTYFNAKRTATVVITERSSHFDEGDATAGIVITAVDVSGKKVDAPYLLSDWQTTEDATNPDAAKHTATIQFLKDANYTFNISYIDMAGNANLPVDTGNSAAPFDFTVDTSVPSGTVTAKSAEGRETTWDYLISTLIFGYWSNQKITISGTSYDVTSPIASVKCYKDISSATNPASTAKSAEQLAAISSWSDFTGFDILPNEQVTVYLKITDMAGNVTYISTNGLIVDDQKPLAETLAPNITVEPQQPVNDIYRGDATVSIKIDDPLVNGAFSGLKEVTYKVFDRTVSSTEPTQSGTLYTFANAAPVQSDLLKTWSGSIVVDSKNNNSNDISVVVYAIDNAGNASENNVTLAIDTTAPTIDVSYDNNSADSTSFFKANRTATIVVTERNFDSKDVLLKITNSDGSAPEISAWAHVDGSGNRDNTKWTATITYATDGDYTFGVTYTDKAGNPCAGAAFAATTVAGTEFTIDKTLPTVSVSYDNNSALNSSYYKSDRTATIVVVEHNFQPDRMKIDLTASDDGTSVTLPSVSSWSSVGDRHIATVNYSADATYSFDISATDKAGNLAAEFEKQSFTIDTTMPKLAITGVVNETAYKGDVSPVVTSSDTNFDASQYSISLTGVNRKLVTPDGSYSVIENGSVFTFKNFAKEKEVDDIYTLSAKLTDKAGNSTTQTITFSVNRYGSTYVLGTSIAKVQGSFVRTPEDVVVTETNPNKLSNIKVTLFKNDATRTLVEGEDYAIVITGGEGKWYQYTYTIFKKNFEDDGVYRISIHSEDEAGNVAENTQDTKDKEISFGVDKTPPNIVVANLENGMTYAVEALTAQLSVNDNLKLATVTIYLDGLEVSSWSGESMEQLIANGGRIEFLIEGDSINAHEVRIVSVDAAGNENTVEIRDFFVTTNLWVRFFNNRALFISVIAGILLLAFIVVLLVMKKRKAPKRARV